MSTATTSVTGTDILDALNWRYATKQFDPSRKIAPETWQLLEEAIRLAPSSFGLQPYKFFVITNPDIRARLREQSWGQPQITDSSHLLVIAARTDYTPEDTAHFVDINAQVRGVEAASLEGLAGMINGALSARTTEDRAAWTKRQAYIALGVFLSAAALLRVDACPMEGFSPAGYDEVLSLEGTGYTATVIAAAGYRSEDDKYGHIAKVRFPADEIISHI